MFIRQLTRLVCPVFFFHAVTCVMFLFSLGNVADGISWLAVPDEQTNAENGSLFILNWNYKIDKNAAFLSSEIFFFNLKFSALYTPMASRYAKENAYDKYQKNDSSFSVFGKKNVTLIVHRAKIGKNIAYCCEVVFKLVSGKRKERMCSKVFVYDVPRITHYIPQLSCKQGDSIKLQCNATGIPKPHLGWIHDDTHKKINSSSDIVLNITGKIKEGRYCCAANNEFGRKTACTAVNVIEYEPENTTLLVKLTNTDEVNIIHIKCKADASPPSNRFIININDKEYNSSDGLKTIEVRATGKDKIHEIAVSCIPCNKYGQGPIKKEVLPLYVPPRFIAPIRTRYNMTVSGIMLKCDPTGIPTPHITWTSVDTGDIVGTGKYYQVLYVKCATKTLRFYCHARNAMGNISSPEIHVEVTTARNCSTADKGLDQTTQTFWKKSTLIGCVVVGLVIVAVVVFALITFWWKRNMEVRKDAETTIPIYEDPYQDPIDAVVPQREGSQFLARSNSTSTDEAYATVEECLRPKREVRIPMNTATTNPHPRKEDPHYESLVQSVPSEI